MNTTAALAHSITWAGSKHSYLTIRLLADRDLVDDCLRAYAYFRWADDVIDTSFYSSTQASTHRSGFIDRQKSLITTLYQGKRPRDLCPQEEMLADLIAHDRGSNSGLRSFIDNFMAVIEFDATRNGRLVSRSEMTMYTTWLATAVMDGIQYFIGNSHSYPRTPDRILAVTGAHLVHMLRDMVEDLSVGYINIPVEDIQARSIPIDDVESEPFRQWVRQEVERARGVLKAGKRYIDTLDILRCKLAGAWYCVRFEWFLNVIQRDGYRLRRIYPDRPGLAAWAGMIWVGMIIILKHLTRPLHRHMPPVTPGNSMVSKTSASTYRYIK